MGGGLLQLVAYGAQDVYLTGNPQITFFKVVYRRHTNFSMESIEQTLNGTVGFGKRVTCQVSRNGDLIHRVWLELSLPTAGSSSSDSWADHIGLRCIKYVELEIGGQRIDKHYPEWMYIWNELSLNQSKYQAYKLLTCGSDMALDASTPKKLYKSTTKVYVPLEFWFCRNVGLALPLIALQYHEVKINIEFQDKTKCLFSSGSNQPTGDLSGKLWIDYIFLDTDERRRFAQLSHEYLIEQLQFTGDESITSGKGRVKLNFNHPCKELAWVCINTSDQGDNTSNNWTTFTTSSANNVLKAKLQLNGQDRFTERDGDYFNVIQPWQHHERVPNNRGINVYSFALKPEEHQPSGTLNMSRIDTAVLDITTESSAKTIKVFATNYNVLRIMSGMGGLAYSN